MTITENKMEMLKLEKSNGVYTDKDGFFRVTEVGGFVSPDPSLRREERINLIIENIQNSINVKPEKRVDKVYLIGE